MACQTQSGPELPLLVAELAPEEPPDVEDEGGLAEELPQWQSCVM